MRKQLGRYCGPSHDVGEALCAWIVTEKGLLLSRTSVIPLTAEEEESDSIKTKKTEWEATLKERPKNRNSPVEEDSKDDKEETPNRVLYEPIREDEKAMPVIEEADDVQHEAYDKHLTARVRLPQGDGMSLGIVLRRKRESNGDLFGRSNANPFLGTSEYEVKFDPGEVYS